MISFSECPICYRSHLVPELKFSIKGHCYFQAVVCECGAVLKTVFTSDGVAFINVRFSTLRSEEMNAYRKYLYIERKFGDVSADQYFKMCSEYMDDDIKANVNTKLKSSPYTPDQFLKEYCEAHLEKFGTEFEWQ